MCVGVNGKAAAPSDGRSYRIRRDAAPVLIAWGVQPRTRLIASTAPWRGPSAVSRVNAVSRSSAGAARPCGEGKTYIYKEAGR